MGEMVMTATATIPAPAEKVWELSCDTARYAEWVKGTSEVVKTDGPAHMGSTYDEINPILGPWKARSHWTVVEHAPPNRSVHAGEGLPLCKEFSVETVVSPVGDDACEFTLTLRATPSGGPAGRAFFSLMKGQTERDNRKNVENFAELAGRELGARQASPTAGVS